MKQNFQRLYDGAEFCSSCDHCPVVDHYLIDGVVVLRDPAKPARGRFTMTVDEYNNNNLVRNAKPIV